ncbi:MAG: peptidoglycan editing factor PgeF [Filifactoraceae bacterium]
MNYIIKSINQKRYITFPRLTELGLNNIFTTKDMDFRNRENSISTEDFKSNYEILKEALNAKDKLLFSSNQIHSSDIISITDLNQGDAYSYGRTLPPVDGLITNLNSIILKTTYADCTPLLIYDPINKCQANLHSGWRGTVKKIGYLGVSRLSKEYNSNPANMIAVIGPAIGKASFEVEKDVVEQFKYTFDFWQDVVTPKESNKYLIDIKETNKKILIAAGLKEENILVCPLDTFNNPLFHSHRFHGTENAGRMIMLSTLT